MPGAAEDLFRGAAIAPVRLADGVLARLSEAILDGRLPAGGALPSEARLAENFGVSKQVVREAIRQLAALGVLEIGQGRATRVRAMDAEPLGRFWRFAVGDTRAGLAEAVELRRIIEPQVARLAARRAEAEGLAALEAALARMRAAPPGKARWIEADLDFHDQLARLSGNRLVHLQVQGLRPVIARLMERFNAVSPRGAADWTATWDRHARVARAVAAGDPDAAEAAMLDHFEAADVAISALFPREDTT